MDCVAFDKHLKALMQREHLEKAQVNLSVNRFQAEYGKDSFPTDDWIIKHSTLKVGAAKEEAGVTKYPSVVTDGRKIEMQRVIALANNRLFKQGIKRVYFIEFEATDIVGQNYRWKLTTQIGDLDLHAKYKRQAAFDTTRGRQESLPTKDTKKLIYGAKPGKQLDLFGNVVNPNDVADFMDDTKISTSNIKPGVSELFESNPELANAVYEALGFNTQKSDVNSEAIEKLKDKIKALRNEDGTVSDAKINDFRNLRKQIQFLERDTLSNINRALQDFIDENKLSESDAKYFKKLATIGDNFQELVEDFNEAKGTNYTTTELMSFFNKEFNLQESIKNESEINKEKNQQYEKNLLENNGFEANKDYTANELDEFVQKHGSNQVKFIWNLIKAVAQKLGVTTRFMLDGTHKIPESSAGHYFGGKIENKASLFNNNKSAARIIVHELVHGVTTYILKAVEQNNTKVLSKLTNRQLKAVEKLNALFNELKKDKEFDDTYGTKNTHELLAELTNESFTDKLKAKNIFEKILEAIFEIFNIPFNAYNESIKILEDLISNPIIENRYEGAQEESFSLYSQLTNQITPQQKQQAQQLYSQYLDTIFPDSKVKDIVYHGTDETFEKFTLDYFGKSSPVINETNIKGISLSGDKRGAEFYGDIILSVVVSITNPTDGILSGNSEGVITQNWKDKDAVLDGSSIIFGGKKPISDTYEIIIRNPEQIHILGSKQDIEGFKEFVQGKQFQKLTAEEKAKTIDLDDIVFFAEDYHVQQDEDLFAPELTLADLDVVTQNKVKEIQQNATFIKLTPDEKHYQKVDKQGKPIGPKLDRVTSSISTEDIQDTDLLRTSSALGTKTDTVIRDFFSNKLKDASHYQLTDAKTFNSFIDQLQQLKEHFKQRGEIPIAEGITLYNDDLKLAGTVDILTVSKDGTFRIYDVKTMRGNNLKDMYYGDTTSKYDSKKYSPDSKRIKHQKQLSLYRMLLANTHGIVAESIHVIPIALKYEERDTQTQALEILDIIEHEALDQVNKYKIADEHFGKAKDFIVINDEVDLFASLLSEESTKQALSTTIKNSVDNRYYYISQSYNRQIESLKRQKQKHTYILTHKNLSEKEQEYHKKEEQKYRRLIAQIQNKQLDILKIKAIEEIIAPTQAQLTEISNKLDSQVVITDEEIAYLYDILDGIIHLGEFEVSKHRHWFFTEEELRAFDAGAANPIMNKIKKQLEEVASEAKRFKNKLNELIEKNLNEDLKATFEDLPAEQQISLKNDTTKDVQYLFSQFIDISEHSDPVFAAIHRWNKDANYKAKLQATEISETFDKLFQKALPILRKHQTRRGGIFDLFMQTQSNQSSLYTGNLVDRYSQSYWNERNKHLISPKLHMTSTRKALSWTKDNELTFNANILFGDKIGKPQDQLKAKQIELLKKELGEEYFEELYKQAEKKVNEFLDARQAFEESLKDELGDNAAAIQGEMEAFDTEFSPFEIANFIVSPSSFTHKKVRPNFKYIVKAPRRTIAGKDTGYYDAKYDEIQKNADLKALYDYYMATMEELKNILPTFNRNLMQRNVIPTVKTTILENFVRSGVLHGLRSIWDSIREGISTQDEKTDVRADIDLATGAEKKSFRSSFAKDYKRELVRLLNIRIIAYFNEHGKNPSRELKETWKKELTNQLSQQKSFDLGRVLKSFAYLTLATYHKQEVEAQMILAKKYVDMKIEQNESNSGTSSRDIKGRAAGKKGSLPRLRAMVDYMYDNFYGYPSHKREVKLTKKTKIINEKGETEKQYKTSGFLSKIYTGIDKNVKKETLALKKQNKTLFESGKLTKDEYAKREKILDEYLNSSGRIWILSMHLDKFLQYVQLNGMGWNIQSGILNMLFGFFANTYEGGAGRIYNMKQLMAAYGLVTSSVFRNATAHVSDKFGKLGITAIKIRNLMNKFDILKESRYELYKPTQSSRSSKITKRFKFLSPYNIQSRTEYINQATAMIATLKNIQITDQNGKSASLWSALDKNGKLKEKFRTPENIKDFEGDINIAEENRKLYAVKARLDKVVKINHGNYDQDSPLLVKRVFVGRMISQFRTWAFEGFKERYQSEKYDAQLGMTRKGRYRSGVAFLLFGDDDVSFWQANNAVRKNILKKLTIGLAYKNTKSLQDVGIKQVDIDNLRKNMMEGLMYLTTIAIKYLIEGLKKAGDDDEEDDQILSFITWFIPLNMINRLETDILFYFNPKEAQNLLMRANTIVPLAKIITDFYKISDAIEKLADDNPQNDVLRSGPNKGENVLLRELSMALPGISGGRRLYNMGQKDYDKLKK